MVEIEVRGKRAKVDKLVWTSDDPYVATVLNNLFTETMGVDPDPDLTVATMAVQRLTGASIVSTGELPEFVEGRIY